ncbi:hypothetical protein [uncultured Methanobrevibacter sp.]|uniref:hypothetical protein n=1 Tax=uncultured Methanobrevibacter sp. TaxID=253161 RepID=UPI0025EDA03B|nr:hypothetical protein [uncultured Methanobrevibacter sp.]
MKLSEVTDDKSFIAFLYSMYLGRLANDGEPDDYYAVEISNQLMHAYVRVTILKIPDAFDKEIMAEMFGKDIATLLREFRVLEANEETTKYQNWHYQLYAAKERYEKDVKRYEEKIKEFFNGHADMIEFDVDQDVVKVRGRYEHPIPPKLIMEFCDKFGYYMPTLKNDWIGTSMFRHVHYRFSKKDCRISKEV